MSCNCKQLHDIVAHYFHCCNDKVVAHNHAPEYYRLGYLQGRMDLLVEMMNRFNCDGHHVVGCQNAHINLDKCDREPNEEPCEPEQEIQPKQAEEPDGPDCPPDRKTRRRRR